MSKKAVEVIENPTPLSFTLRFIETVRETRRGTDRAKYAGVHTLYDKVAGVNFNDAYRTVARAYGWDEVDPVKATQAMHTHGIIVGRVKGMGRYIVSQADATPLRDGGKGGADLFAALRLQV